MQKLTLLIFTWAFGLLAASLSASANVVTLSASQDDMLWSETPASPYPGGCCNYYLTVNSSGVIYGLIQFDLSGLAGDTIASATFEVDHQINQNIAGLVFGLYALTTSWNAGSTDFNNAPSQSASPFASFTAPTFGYQSIDITAMVQDWVNGSTVNNGFALAPEPVSVTYPDPYLYFEASSGPDPEHLVINYSAPLAVPEPSALALLGAALLGFTVLRLRRQASEPAR